MASRPPIKEEWSDFQSGHLNLFLPSLKICSSERDIEPLTAMSCSRKCILVWWIFDKMIKYAPTPTCFGQKHETNRAVAVWCGVWSICGRRDIISVDRLPIFPKEDALYIGLECDVIIKIQEKYYLWTTVDLSSKTGNHSCLDWEISTKRNFAESP